MSSDPTDEPSLKRSRIDSQDVNIEIDKVNVSGTLTAMGNPTATSVGDDESRIGNNSSNLFDQSNRNDANNDTSKPENSDSLNSIIINDDDDNNNNNDDGDNDSDDNDDMINQMIEDNAQKWQNRIQIVREHYEKKGYRVHSGLQFGCELVLYADDPSRVHSDFCVHVIPEDGSIDWKAMQTLVRSMGDFHKTLILAYAHKKVDDDTNANNNDNNNNNNKNETINETTTPKFHYVVDEIALTTGHAPFRQKKASVLEKVTNVGQQLKRKNNGKNDSNDPE